MSKFIKVTTDTGISYLNADNIEAIHILPRTDRITVCFSGNENYYQVIETPEEILSMIENQQYTEADMTAFGNYLLSAERRSRVISSNKSINERRIALGHVSHADFENWKGMK